MKTILVAMLMLGVTLAHADDRVLRIGDSKGMFKALLTAAGELDGVPYEIQWSEFGASAPALEALAAGAIDLRGAAAAPMIFALASGAPLKAVAALRLTGPKEAEAILVPPNSPIHHVADLRGKRIGTNKGSVGHYLILAALRREGIPFSAVTIDYLMPADAKAAVGGGSIDAWSTWDPYVSIAEVQDHFRPIVDATGLPITEADYVTSAASLAAKRPLLLDFLKRQARAQVWAHQHLEVYAKLYSTQTGLPVEVTRQIVRHMDYELVPIDDEVIHEHQDTADTYLQAGIIHQPINASLAFDRSLFTNK
jgi:sulfonate transport system substrate-binding protein